MSNCQDQPRRTSSRSTKGTPPARYQQYASEMSVNNSPKSDTPAKSQQRQPQLQPMDGTTHVNTINPPSQLQHQKTAANSPAGTSKPVNEVGEFMKQMRVQMEQMQRQMQVMQSEYIASTKKMQAQLVNTAKQVETQLANQMTSTSLSALPTSTLPQPPSNMPESILPTSQPSLPPPNQSQYQPPQNLLQQPPQLSPLQQQVYQPTPQYPPPSRSINSDMSVHNSYPQSFISVPHKKIYPLPTFSGLPEEWQTFYEAYESTTAEFGYNSLHNIMRLRDAIKGRARETVESLLGNSANVDTIIRTLLETFGRPEQLIRSQIEKVRAIPPLANDNLEALVNFANKISNMATFVKNVKGDHHLSNPSLLSELVAKLSTSRQMQWAEKCLQLQQPATIVGFAEWLSVLRRLANIVHDTLPSTSTNAASNRRHFAATAPPPNRKYVNVTVSQCPVCKVPIETPTLLSEFGPIVSTTRLGAVIYGPIPGEEPTNIKRALHVRKCVYQNDVLKELSDMMRGYFDVETLGTKIPVKPIKSKEDERAMGILETNTKQVNDRYECSLLWREDVRPIPDSYNMALNRLYSVERKMAKDKNPPLLYVVTYKRCFTRSPLPGKTKIAKDFCGEMAILISLWTLMLWKGLFLEPPVHQPLPNMSRIKMRQNTSKSHQEPSMVSSNVIMWMILSIVSKLKMKPLMLFAKW
ncbi:uncharacterized protein LOC131994912 isoform X2 [Stomoxys calcitrans]|uniref:uncharacterized protein LOC131994912 isoform X2 n=1 Tax=Stomoxys calcitrans TaxID=35570 RepID=UPI0027E371DB|nr:uncharacterized protein LOC131994912 isoform X2 [Stomoxys calcitrans]